MKPIKILVAEDEETIREFIVINLKRAGYDVVEAFDGLDAYEKYKLEPDEISIAVLDIMMPRMDGLELCKKLRALSNNIGIMMLTAKTQEMDKVKGLMLGADDYVTKPFSPSELAARVDAICRRISVGSEMQSDVLTSGPFVLNMDGHTFTKNGKPIDLTQVEFQIMELFIRNPSTALVREKILEGVWGKSYYGDVKIVDVNIRRLRMKVEDEPSNPQHILTVWGYGYRWNA